MAHRPRLVALMALLIAPISTGCASVGASSATQPTSAATPSTPPKDSGKAALLPNVDRYLASVEPGIEAIPTDRKEMLNQISSFVDARRSAGADARLVFICTHNSRRSQMGQLWAAAAAAYYGVDHVQTFSGGLEVTAFNERAIAAVQRAGIEVSNATGKNPHVTVTYARDRAPLEMFSKTYGDPFNPQGDFAAVMTCSHADASCPLVLGASARIPLHYEDPKASDGKPEEAATYDERSRQIATEMLYVFSRVKTDRRPLVSHL